MAKSKRNNGIFDEDELNVIKNEKTKNLKSLNTVQTEAVISKKIQIKCKTERQKELINLIDEKEITIVYGPAGTGKSYLALIKALQLVLDKSNTYYKLMLTTPAVEADEKLGFLPGDVNEKLAPYLYSSFCLIDKIVGKESRIQLVQSGKIEIIALAYLRGVNIDNTILILDEAQNATPRQIKTLLTRIGGNSKFILNGDLEQSDKFSNFKNTGLYDAINRHKNLSEIGIFEFNDSDMNVRNPIITKLLKNYEEN